MHRVAYCDFSFGFPPYFEAWNMIICSWYLVGLWTVLGVRVCWFYCLTSLHCLNLWRSLLLLTQLWSLISRCIKDVLFLKMLLLMHSRAFEKDMICLFFFRIWLELLAPVTHVDWSRKSRGEKSYMARKWAADTSDADAGVSVIPLDILPHPPQPSRKLSKSSTPYPQIFFRP